MNKIKCFAGMVILLCMVQLPVLKVEATEKTLYESPYVRFSPDGWAWTFCEILPSGGTSGRPDYWYQAGETQSTGIRSSLKELQPGQHYYETLREGVVPVGKWVVAWPNGQCIHPDTPKSFHNLSFREQRCLSGYYSGWLAYCADCNRPVDDVLIYGSRKAVSSVHFLDTELDHYYLCPTCSHLEQGSSIRHRCAAVSYNMYRVVYDSNSEYMGKRITGFVPESYHMYNNEIVFEGTVIVPNTHLNLNSYELTGYTFAGWNTRPDGSGVAYEDGAEIRNLSTENYDKDGGSGEVILYAQWIATVSELVIDPNGGSYRGSRDKTAVRQTYGAAYIFEQDALIPPEGYTVAFESNGGNTIPQIRSRYSFKRWSPMQPFGGSFQDGKYLFTAAMNHVDVIKAVYNREPVELPTPEREDYAFGGWFRDEECTDFAGMGGAAFLPDRDITLYAGWTKLHMEAETVYYREEALDDWRTAGSICHGVKNERGEGDNRYGVPSDESAVLYATGAVDVRLTMEDERENFFRVWRSDETDTSILSDVYEELKNTGQSASVEQSVWCKMIDSESGVVPDTEENYNATYLLENSGTDAQIYRVRADGLYTLRAAGGQGGDYEGNSGGYGGEAAMTVYLKKGEVLTVTLGKQGAGADAPRTPGGCEGGASGTNGAAGGSATRIQLTDLYGVTTDLLVAAGGGGAGSRENGYPASDGYATLYTVRDYASALSRYGLVEDVAHCDGILTGGGGGGGGFFHGTGGSVTVHTHSDRPVWSGSYNGQAANVTGLCTGWQWTSGGTHYGHVTGASCEHYGHWGIVNGVCAQACNMDDGSWWYLCRCNVCGQRNSPHVKETYYYTCNDCGVYLDKNSSHVHPSYWTLTCTKLEGVTVDGTAPSYGGLSYINTQDCHYGGNVEYDNCHQGDGYVSVTADTVGFTETGLIAAIPARDMAKPDAVSNITFEVIEGVTVIKWSEPEGNASVYYFFGESYCREGAGMKKRLTTNILSQKVDTAIAGYYYMCDENAEVSADYLRKIVESEERYTYEERNAALFSQGLGFSKDCRLDTEDVGNCGNRAYDPAGTFVHIAAADVAGNVSDTVTVRLKHGAVPWGLETGPLRLDSVVAGKDNKNVWYAGRERTWYVKADGETPFLLAFESYMAGTAREDYQINYQILDARTAEGISQKYTIMIPYAVPVTRTGELDSSEFLRRAAGDSVLGEGTYLSVSRSNNAADVSFCGAFTLAGEMDGREIVLTPVAGADFAGDTIYSDWSEDMGHSLTVIADGKGPVIGGLDRLEEQTLLDRNEGEVWLEITAADALSGMAEFYVQVENRDNFVQQTFYSENDVVRIELTELSPLFSGTFTVTGYARDKVGNETKVTYQVTEFALETGIERILEPHAPVFKGGESGILTITTYGYADRVEVIFPEEMTALNPELNRIIDYTEMQCYKQESRVQFMVPLYTPENSAYRVTVRAYKGNSRLEEHPVISTVTISGSVLDELRTRLR
ncbi:MAG: InlB B-repeat-containing protein [Acetatifactor sp.]